MVVKKLCDRTKAMLKKKATEMTEKKTVKYGDEPGMKRVNPQKEPKNKMKG